MSKPALSQPAMQKQVKRINLNDLYPLIKETLDSGRSFILTPTGSSMNPFIAGGRDVVTLSPITEPLKKYDVPFYRRKNGDFVLHRIIRVEKDGTYTCCGDHQWNLERGLTADQMIAVATSYVRKGRSFTNKNFWYRLYCRVWTFTIPIRRTIFKIDQKWKHRKILVFRKRK